MRPRSPVKWGGRSTGRSAFEALAQLEPALLELGGFEVLYLGWYATQRPAEVAQRIRLVVNERQRLFAAAA